MKLSFTEKKSVRKNFGKLKEILSIPNLIQVQKLLITKLRHTAIDQTIQKKCIPSFLLI